MGTLARFSTRIFLLLIFTTTFSFSHHVQAQCTFTNGDFETGNLSGWTQYNRSNDVGNWYNYTGTLTPLSSHSISAPPQGGRAATSDQNAATTHELYQDFTLPAGQSGTLTFYIAYNNTWSSFITLNTLDFVSNQQARIDLMRPSAAHESIAGSDIWVKLFQTKPGDPLAMSPTLMTYDVSGFAGLSTRLRFAQGVGLSYFPFAVDNVCLSTTRGTINRSTTVGSNVSADFGGVTLRFPSVATAGTTSLQQLDPATVQTGAPVGDTFIGPAYNITTTAVTTAPITVCMYLPSITDDVAFNKIRLLHKEAGIWVDLPSSRRNMLDRQLCGDVLTLSQFTAAVGSLPSASQSSISGKITNSGGTALAGVTVSLEGAATRKTITDSNGAYRFDGVNADNFYTVTPSRLNYAFSPSNRSFSLLGSVNDAAFTANDSGSGGQVIDTADYFVRQHYLDFLSREPDESGFNFWSDQILSCGNDASCNERRRINVSAAYFKSIEFQETGGLVDALYRASYDRRPLYAEFMPDVSVVGHDVIVGQATWSQQLEANKQAFLNSWVQRPAFTNAYDGLNNDAFVDALISHASGFDGDRNSLVSGLNSGALTRANALRQIVENAGFVHAKSNQMFVMMEYFGYLRRDPDEAGYNFWLNKLNQFDGNFEQAEMVKSFIVSGEYRDRFTH
ncbi:MAG TPA: DUF4214 domain-containing protein [Pyrinomonadaceae bacterium]|nr:DUF4214 domain-containing protein [Pyrinomonadaceae bacterium]